MLNQLLASKKLPPLGTKEEMLDILFKEEYGYMPPKPEKVTWTETTVIRNFCAGKATLTKVDITSEFNGKSFTFPFYVTMPTKDGVYPFFIHINFRADVPDRYMPTEELVDNGFAVLSFGYKDVTSDNGDFTDGLAGVLYENGQRNSTDAGKLAMWAWAAHRVMDYACTIDKLDKKCSVVCGHSRQGKTALLTAATDERFCFVHSNNSGCSGSAITRGKDGETVKDICKLASFWFCENYQQYIDNEENMPFDQHYLVASIAPRFVHIGSAETDIWADPVSEMLTCVAASPAFEKHNKKGFVCENRLPQVGDVYHEGSIGYHLRKGTHYFSREDWLLLIDFINRHKNEI
ncbi:MAG: hypothetical protein IKW59_02505 [Clostridia bacterium]|nr:hypothetical protein [Clostridia bacterium]